MKKNYQKPEMELSVFVWNELISNCTWSQAVTGEAGATDCTTYTHLDFGGADQCTSNEIVS